MNKLSYLIIITVFLLCNCNPKQGNTKSPELSKQQIRDSISSILISVSDDWAFLSSQTSSENKILLPEIDEINIRHWTKINSKEPLNELNITGLAFKYIDSTNTMEGLGCDYEAKVEYRNKKFGLKIINDSVSGFVGINELNETSLILTNGQRFKRKK